MQPVGNSSRTQVPLKQIVSRILASGRITRADEKIFFKALVTETALSSEEMDLIHRVLDRMQMGLIKVTD